MSGETTRRRSVVLVSGAEDVSVFDGALQALQSEETDVHTIQLPGFGRSEHNLSTLSGESICEAVTSELLERSPGCRVILAGHSMGGLAVLAAGADRKVREQLRLERLVLLAPSFSLADPIVRRVCGVLARLDSGNLDRLCRGTIVRTAARRLNNALLRLKFPCGKMPFRRMYAETCKGSAEPACFASGVLLPEQAPVNMLSLFYGLICRALNAAGKITAPIVLVEAEDDRWVPHCSAAVLERLNPSLYLTLPGGHFFPAYRPDAVVNAVTQDIAHIG